MVKRKEKEKERMLGHRFSTVFVMCSRGDFSEIWVKLQFSSQFRSCVFSYP
jgi:hypothetical protein